VKERKLKVAFILLTHKSAPFVQRLISQLNAAKAPIFVHVDRGTRSVEYAAIRSALAKISAVHWLPRYYSHWGSWGLVQASLSGLRQAQQTGSDYAVLLSGQDYPIKSLAHLLSFLEENNGTSFLQYHQLPSDRWPADGSSRYVRWHFNLAWRNSSFRRLANRALSRVFNSLFPGRTLPDQLTPYGGWQWWCLHRDAVAYILEFSSSSPKVVRFFKNVRIPDEMYFQTVLMNSPLSSCIQNRLLTYADWQGPPYPRILTQADFEILKTGDFFFARKFDPEVDTVILDRIDRELLQP
jgi:hypothetical protein